MLTSFFKSFGKKVTFIKGDVIVDCNDAFPNGVYLLDKGYVKAFSVSERGNEHVHIIYKAGEIFPARWAFGLKRGSLVYMAMTTVVAWKAEKKVLTEYLSTNPKELQKALTYINNILDIFVNRVNDLEHNSAYLRVASRLVSLTHRFGKAQDHGSLIEAPVTQHDIAASLSLTRESVSREMSKLEQKGIIEYRNQLIFIKDLAKLEEEIRSFPE